LEKSILDHRKPGIISKVCSQVADYYAAALKKIETSNGKNEEEPISESIGDKKNRFDPDCDFFFYLLSYLVYLCISLGRRDYIYKKYY
jgi:hypothetical protein